MLLAPLLGVRNGDVVGRAAVVLLPLLTDEDTLTAVELGLEPEKVLYDDRDGAAVILSPIAVSVAEDTVVILETVAMPKGVTWLPLIASPDTVVLCRVEVVETRPVTVM